MIRLALGCFSILVIAATGLAGAVWFSLSAETLDYLGWLAMWTGRVALALVVVAVSMVANGIYHKRESRERTPVDGAYRIIRVRVHKWPSDKPFFVALFLFIKGKVKFIDPNRIQGSSWEIDEDGNVVEGTPAAGWALQNAYNTEVEITNRWRSAFTGDDAKRWIGMFGGSDTPPRPTAALVRQKPAQLPGPVDDDIVDGEFSPVAVPFAEAVRSNTPTTFALGQSDQGVVRWDVESAPHIRVHGQTQGSGKTNVIKTIVAAAILQGVHVIILDRRGFKDWRDYHRHVEFIDNRKPGAFAGTMKQLTDIYRERDEALGQAGASNLADLPNAPARLFVVVSEFGTACREAKASGEMSEALPLLKSIMSEAGATGVHMIFEDQAINHNWPPEMRGNAQPICGYLPEDAAKAGGYRLAHHLKPYHFHMEGVCFKTWDMKAEAPRLLAPVPANGRTAIDVSALVPVPVPEQNNNNRPPNPIYSNGHSGNGNGNGERSNKWEAFAKDWLANNPRGGPSALARAMWEADGRVKEYTDYKSEAARRLDALSTNGASHD